MSGFQVAPAEIEAVLHGHPAVRRLRRVRRARRAGRRGAGGRGPAGAGRRPSARRTCSAWWPTRWPRTSACTTWSWSTPSRGRRRARCCAATCATSGPRGSAAARERGRLMDVRLSPEQVALRDAAAQVVDRLGPAHRGRARRRRAHGQARRRRRRVGLARAADAAGRRELPGPRPSRSPSSPRSSAAGWPTPPSWARRWPPSCAAGPAPRRRRARDGRAARTTSPRRPSAVDGALPTGAWRSTPAVRRALSSCMPDARRVRAGRGRARPRERGRRST